MTADSALAAPVRGQLFPQRRFGDASESSVLSPSVLSEQAKRAAILRSAMLFGLLSMVVIWNMLALGGLVWVVHHTITG